MVSSEFPQSQHLLRDQLVTGALQAARKYTAAQPPHFGFTLKLRPLICVAGLMNFHGMLSGLLLALLARDGLHE